MPKRYTFEYRTEDSEWTRSRVRYRDPRGAADEAASWLVICWDNNYPIHVRLVEVKELDPLVEQLAKKDENNSLEALTS